MGQKAKKTRDAILKKTSVIFNRKGYAGTSLSDLTSATRLTKGAIYFNFKNKDELSQKAFKFLYSNIKERLLLVINCEQGSLNKLYAITEFYRKYYHEYHSLGGCPIINFGADSKNINPNLEKEVKKAIVDLISMLAAIIEEGINNLEIKAETRAIEYARNFYTMIQGGLFMSFTLDDESYLYNILDRLDEIMFYNLKV